MQYEKPICSIVLAADVIYFLRIYRVQM
jgi:hypothetical protein